MTFLAAQPLSAFARLVRSQDLVWQQLGSELGRNLTKSHRELIENPSSLIIFMIFLLIMSNPSKEPFPTPGRRSCRLACFWPKVKHGGRDPTARSPNFWVDFARRTEEMVDGGLEPADGQEGDPHHTPSMFASINQSILEFLAVFCCYFLVWRYISTQQLSICATYCCCPN